MSRIILFAIIFSAFNSFAQNWNVINTTDKFNYKGPNDNFITVTLYADSINVFGLDTVFYMNRVFCDSCTALIGDPLNCGNCYGLKNQPQFMQKMVVKSIDGIVNFRDTSNIVIRIFANPGDSWLFDSVQNITAHLSYTGILNVFGNADSVKYILLSTGDSIVVSKNYGILRYPFRYGTQNYYSLAGIEGRNLGEHVPNFKDFFNFDVGDMFEYFTSIGDGSGGSSYEIKSKYTITNKTAYADSFVYFINGFSFTHEYCHNLFSCHYDYYYSGIINQPISFVDSSGHLTNRYNNELIKIDGSIRDHFGLGNIIYDWGANHILFGPVLSGMDSNVVLIKSLTFENFPYPGFFMAGNYNYDSLSDFMIPCDGNNYDCNTSSITAAYGVGLGQTYDIFNCNFECVNYEIMTAYRKGNDTIGTFTPDSVLTVGLDKFSNSNIIIKPNPANNYILVTGIKGKNTEIILKDLQGKIILQQINNNENTELDVENIVNGFYVLLVASGQNIFTKKIIINH